MKRISIAIALVAALFFGLFGCTVEQEAPEIKVESISIDQGDITLTEGESVTLTATVLPENAVDKTIKWSSSDESVVMVSSTGKIAAISVGKASVKAEAGEQSDFISVTVIQGTSGEVDPNLYDDISVTGEASSVTYISAELSGYAYLPFEIADASVGFIYSTDQNPSMDNGTVVYCIDSDPNSGYSAFIVGLSSSTTYYYSAFVRNGRSYRFGTVKSFTTPDFEYEALDMGLSVKWANANLGAAAPDEYGDYYAWGEISTKEDYSWSTYEWCEGTNTSLTKYNTNESYGIVDNKTVLDLKDDAAHFVLGGKWRMPTSREWDELVSTGSNEHYRWLWQAMNGHDGWFVTYLVNNTTIFLPAAGSIGYYWSSSLHSDIPRYAWRVNFYSDVVRRSGGFRFDGFSVRPVYGDYVHVSGIVLDKTSLELNWGEEVQLNATLSPSNAFEQSICWSSSDTKVATVSSEGLITGVGKGEAIITATSVDGGYTASCIVTVILPEMVDLGLSVKWATCNLGATRPQDYGDYYAWGEIEPYYSSQDPLTWKDGETGYNWASYKWCNGSHDKLTKYCLANQTSYWDGEGSPDNKAVLEPEDDAAHVILGGKWRMPTDAEWTELRTKCTWTWTTNYNGTGVKGRIVTATNGSSIFLPAAGSRDGTYLSDEGSYGYYWSSSLYTGYPDLAWYVYFYSDYVSRDYYCFRYYGLSVRPVSE